MILSEITTVPISGRKEPIMVRAMILEPGKHAEVRHICPREIKSILGGVPEITEPMEGIALAVNEEGKIKGLPLNRSLVDDDGMILDIYAGTMVFLACTKEKELHSLTDEQIILLLEEFGEPETPADWVDEPSFTKADVHALLDVLLNKLFS